MKLLASTLLFLIITFSANAVEDVYLECFDCSNSEITSQAFNWTQNKSIPTRNYQVHIADIVNGTVTSFEADRYFEPMEDNFIVNVYAITSSSNLQAIVEKYKTEVDSLIESVKSLQSIPISVIPHAWAFINCAYCAYCTNDVEQYVQNTLNGKILPATKALAELTSVFGLIKTNIPNVFRIPLAAGGYVEVKIKLNAEPLSLNLYMVKVVDKDRNTLPELAEGLNYLRVIFSNRQNAAKANGYIFSFGFIIRWETQINGVVTITNCTEDGNSCNP